MQLPPAPYYSDEHVTVLHGDSLALLLTMDTASIDAVVTDPPYGLEFMGKDWDGPAGFSRATAGQMPTGYTDGAERLARPSFLGGLNPKCLACGRWQRGAKPCRCDVPEWTQERLVRLHTFQEWCEQWAVECLRVLKPGGYLLAFGGSRTWHRLASAVEDAGFEIRDSIAWLYGSGFPKSLNVGNGRGTALKPAFEPIVVGRKPLIATVAANVAQHGTGALNIDACRTSTNGERLHTSSVPNDMRGGHYRSGHRPGEPSADRRYTAEGGTNFAATPGPRGGDPKGRWPTNVVLDESQAAALDAQTGVLTSGKMRAGTRPIGALSSYGQDAASGYETKRDTPGDSGGASRFFPTFHYEAKAATSERPRGEDGTAHPTVKPLDLMRWLVRLVTPSGGLVLDPFLGSGTTAEACALENRRCVGIERDETYLPLVRQRLSKPMQSGLDFGPVTA